MNCKLWKPVKQPWLEGGFNWLEAGLYLSQEEGFPQGHVLNLSATWIVDQTWIRGIKKPTCCSTSRSTEGEEGLGGWDGNK